MLRIAIVVACVIGGSSALRADPVTAGVDLPSASRGTEQVPSSWFSLAATKGAIVVEGRSIISLANGAVDAAEKEGGSLGISIPRLVRYINALVALEKTHTPSGPPSGMLLLLDKNLPYHTLIEIMFSTKQAAIKDFALACKTGTSVGVIKLSLPDKAMAKPAKPPLGMVVTITKDKILVWSISGDEGSLKKPKLELPRGQATKLTATLAEIAKRRKPQGDDTSVIVMADGAIPVTELVDVMVAVKTTDTGQPLFPNVLLSAGFE